MILIVMNTLACISVLSLAGAAFLQPASAQKVRLGEVFVVNTVDLKQDAAPEAFEAYVMEQMLPA